MLTKLKKYHYMIFLMMVYIVSNIAIYFMQYSVSASIVLRFLPSWIYVIILGNIIITIALIIMATIKIRYRNRRISYIDIYNVCLLFFIVISIMAGVLTQGEAIRTMLFYDKTDMFMDFFNSIQYFSEPYSHKIIYPPLINCVYAFLGSMVPLNGVITEHALYLRDQQMSWIVLYGVTMLTMLGIAVLIWKFLNKEKSASRTLFIIGLFFSLPFVFVIERGNSLLYTVFFLLAFLYLYKEEKKRFRYLAYVSLAIATGIKIAPVIFGALIIRRRDWREVGIALAIVSVIFYVPFFFLDGDLGILFSNIQYTTALFQSGQVNGIGTFQMIGNGVYVNLWNTLDTIGRILNINLWNVSRVMSAFILLISAGCILFAPKVEEWKLVMLLSLILILLPGFSAIYCLLYLMLPLVMFLRDNHEVYKRINYAYLILFLCAFVPIVNFRFKIFAPFTDDAYLMRLSTIIESFALLVLFVLLIVDILYHLDTRLSKRIAGICVAVSLVYSTVIFFVPKAAISFVPGDMSVVNAAEGLILEHGRYCGISPNGKLTLHTQKIKEEGLIVAASKSIEGESVNIFLDGKKVSTHLVDGNNWYVYIPAEEIACIGLGETVEVSLAYEGRQESVPLVYVGVPRLTDVINSGTYMHDISEGFWRKQGEGILRMGSSSQVLLDGDMASKGLIVRYDVPDNLITSNINKDVELEFYADGRKVKTVPVRDSGEQELVLQASELKENCDFPYALELMIKCNSTYRESDYSESLDNRAQSIKLLSIGNADAESEVVEHYLRGREKVYLSAEELKEDGLSIVYKIDQAKLYSLKKCNLKIELVVDGQLIDSKSLIESENDLLNGFFVSPDKFYKKESIVSVEIRITQEGNIPWEIFSREKIGKMIYAGANQVMTDYELTKVKEIPIGITGIVQDRKDKKMYMGHSGEVLFLYNDMIGHDLVINYEVPQYLINDETAILSMEINNQDIQKEYLKTAGQKELRIPAECLQSVLVNDKRAVIPVRLVVNKVFDPNVLHIFSIGGGEKSIVLNSVYLD